MATFLDRLRLLLTEEELFEAQYMATSDQSKNIVTGASQSKPEHLLHNPSHVDLLYADECPKKNSGETVDHVQEEDDRTIAYTTWERSNKSRKSQSLTRVSPLKKLVNPELDWPGTNLSSSDKQRGFLAARDLLFCPITAISKYPYKYVSRKLREPIAEMFFAAGKFWERHWDIYYTWPPYSVSHKALLLVPAFQVERLLAEVNQAFTTAFLTLTSESEDIGLTFRFIDHPDLTPRYLGQSRSRTEFSLLEQGVPSSSYRPANEKRAAHRPSDIDLKQWKRKMEAMFEQTRTGKKNKKAMTEPQRTEKKQGWSGQLEKTQMFLGLRPKEIPKRMSAINMPIPTNDIWIAPEETPNMTWDQIKNVLDFKAKSVNIPPIDSFKPSPYSFYKSVIFFAVDVELKEGHTGILTEVGISTLDTNDLTFSSPGTTGESWMKYIRKRHFRIREHLHHINHNYVDGCPSKFEFGSSEIISHSELPEVLSSCFNPPYFAKEGAITTEIPRNLVLVGHDIKSDIKALQGIGCHIYDFAEFYETIDTADLYRALKHEWNLSSLGAILYEFNITGWNLHNAGNDAAYTMMVLLAIAIRNAETRTSGEKRKGINEEQPQKSVDETNEAIIIVTKERQAWDSREDQVASTGDADK